MMTEFHHPRVVIEDGQVSVVCPDCHRPFIVPVVQNQTDGASYAKTWKKLERGTDKICKVLLMSHMLEELKNGMSKRDIIKNFIDQVPEIQNPARISELIGIGIFTVDKSKHPPVCCFKPTLAGLWVANTYNNSNKHLS
jgi:hypothetical protein